jgi:hypothetical protein
LPGYPSALDSWVPYVLAPGAIVVFAAVQDACLPTAFVSNQHIPSGFLVCMATMLGVLVLRGLPQFGACRGVVDGKARPLYWAASAALTASVAFWMAVAALTCVQTALTGGRESAHGYMGGTVWPGLQLHRLISAAAGYNAAQAFCCSAGVQDHLCA